MLNSFVAFIHFIGAFGLVAAMIYEMLTYSRQISLKDAIRLQAVDSVYGAMAGVVLIAGILRVIYFEKGTAYYLDNTWFYIKISTFILVGLLTIYPTVVFARWRKQTRAGQGRRR